MIELIQNLLASTSSDSNQLNHFDLQTLHLKSQVLAFTSAALHQLETLSLIQIAKVRLMFHAGFDETKIEPSHFRARLSDQALRVWILLILNSPMQRLYQGLDFRNIRDYDIDGSYQTSSGKEDKPLL